MTEGQAYLLLGTIWLMWSFWAHTKDESTTSFITAVGGTAFLIGAIFT